MAGNGYVRQSVADIINGENITAPPLNAEFNALEYAFDGTTGHTHDGSTGGGPLIDLVTSITGYLPAIHGGVGGRNNTAAVIDPTQLDDSSDGYNVGSIWVNFLTSKVFICVDKSQGAAVWHQFASVSPQNKWEPVDTGTVDLGSAEKAFKDLYLTGAVQAATLDGELGGSAPAPITGTTITSTEGFTGDLAGNVVGDVTGDLTGDVKAEDGTLVLDAGTDGTNAAFTGSVTGAVTGTFSGTADGAFTGTFTGALDADQNKIVNLGDPENDADAVNKRWLDQTIAQGVNSVAQYREDAQKLATSPEDQDFNISTGFYGYSALHYNAKAQQAKVDAYAARDAAAQSEYNAGLAEQIAIQKAATISNGLDSKEYRLIGVLI